MPTNLSDIILTHISVENKNLFTAIPAIITDVSLLSSGNKVSVEPALDLVGIDGTVVKLPILPELPVHWQSGGGAVMTFPLAVGDDVLVVFSMRSIVEFQNSQTGTVKPFDRRHHNISDGYVIPGIFRDQKQPSPDANDVVIKYDDGDLNLVKGGTIHFDTTSTFAVSDGTEEIIDLLLQLITQVEAITVNTSLGPQPIINKLAVTNIKTAFTPFKET